MIQTKFSTTGDSVNVFNLNTKSVSDKLEAQVYTLQYSMLAGFYLKIDKPSFILPSKLFGAIQDKSIKIQATYHSRSTSTGILLTGDKGSGKTLLVQHLANAMITKGIPVVCINEAYAGDNFNSFISSLGEVVIIFDEFEKVYGTDEGPTQQDLLTLFDGTASSKRLMLLTANQAHKIDKFFIDRPGRIYYHLRYEKLEESTTMEYCAALGISETVTNEIIEISRQTFTFSFDMLQAIVAEYKQFPAAITEVIKDLNITMPFVSTEYNVVISKIIHTATGKEIIAENNTFKRSALRAGFSIIIDTTNEYDDNYIYLTESQIKYNSLDKFILVTENYSIIASLKECPITTILF